jgi:hypothetical protein
MHRIQCSNWLFRVQVSYLYYKIVQSDHLIHWIVFRLAISSNSIEIALVSFTTNSYSKQSIRTLYSMHKMIWLDDFVEQIRNSYSKILWQSGLDFCILLKDNIFPTIGILSDKTIEIIAGIDKGILLIIF